MVSSLPSSTTILLPLALVLLPAAAGYSLQPFARQQQQLRRSQPQHSHASTARFVHRVAPLRLQEDAAPAPLESYDDAEARGFQLFQAGEYERAIRMFELAQTLPGAGVDFKRVKQGGMIGSATAPPNPREWGEDRFATAEQKAVAEYNIACCYAAMGDKLRTMELLRLYTAKVGEPLNQVNEMLVDDDLIAVRDELRALREEYKQASGSGGGGFNLFGKLKEAANEIGVEWKD